MRWILFTLLVTPLAAFPASANDAETARTLTNYLAIVLDGDDRMEVMSSADVREVVALEGDKAAMGCDVEATSCLAEVAGALGARYVVFSQLGRLGSQYLLTLNLFDSEAGSSSGRQVVRASSAEAIADALPDAVGKLLGGVKKGEGQKPKMLVLDVRPPEGAGAASAPPPATAEPAGLNMLGLGTAGVGVLSLAAGVAAGFIALGHEDAAESTNIQLERERKYEAADLTWITSAALVGVGAAVTIGGTVWAFSE